MVALAHIVVAMILLFIGAAISIAGFVDVCTAPTRFERHRALKGWVIAKSCWAVVVFVFYFASKLVLG